MARTPRGCDIYSSLTSSSLLFAHLPWRFQLSHTLTILELTGTFTVQKFFLNSPCAPGLGAGVESRAGGSISEIRLVAVGKPWTNHCPKVESYKIKHCHSGIFVTLGKSCTLLCSPSGVSKLFLQGSDSKEVMPRGPCCVTNPQFHSYSTKAATADT